VLFQKFICIEKDTLFQGFGHEQASAFFVTLTDVGVDTDHIHFRDFGCCICI
jgi:hypothetical protein